MIYQSLTHEDLLLPRHSFTTRLLYSLIPSSMYAKEFNTIDAFSEGMARDFESMFRDGITIQVSWLHSCHIVLDFFLHKEQQNICLRAKAENDKFTFHPTLIAVKGDWPFVRKAFHMSVGFKSRRVCHLCPGADSCLSEKNWQTYTFKSSHGVGRKNTAYQLDTTQ